MNRTEWLAKCRHWKDQWPVMQPEYLDDANGQLNLYAVLDAISNYSTVNDVLMGDAGSISYAGPVALRPKAGQKMVFSPAQADMGWALPGAIGVALAGAESVISIIGDGSFMSNLQELAVVRQHGTNIKFVILNNGGYLSIKNTQQKYFNGRVHGTSNETGLWFPDFGDIARSFGLDYLRVNTLEGLSTDFAQALRQTGPMIIDCACKTDQEILPAQALKNGQQCGLHDMLPFLSDAELAAEMIVQIK